MANHRVYFSFEYNKDYWRAVQICNLGNTSAVSVILKRKELRNKYRFVVMGTFTRDTLKEDIVVAAGTICPVEGTKISGGYNLLQ